MWELFLLSVVKKKWSRQLSNLYLKGTRQKEFIPEFYFFSICQASLNVAFFT